MSRKKAKYQLEPVDVPLMFPAIEGDVENADGGIGIVHATRDLVVHVTYPFLTPVGTVFQLFWGSSSPVGFYLVRDGDPPRTRFPLTVPVQFIREPRAFPVYCKIISNEDGPPQTPPLNLRVNLGRPGGQAPEPIAGGNRNLVLELEPEVDLEGVSEQKAKVGVFVTCRKWLNMRVYDQLILAWGSQKIIHWVQLNEVDRDITVKVTPEMIEAGGDSEMLPVAMTVVGATGNLPDERAPWSEVKLVSVHANSQRREAPFVSIPAVDTELDLAEIGNGAVEIGFVVLTEDLKHYTHAHVFWTGTTSDGGSISHTETREIPSARAYYFDIPNGIVAASAKGSTYTYYMLEGPAGLSPRSNYRHLKINGEIVQWPPPDVDGEADGAIDPDLPQVHVRIQRQPTWKSFDGIELKLLASGPSGTIEHSSHVILGEIPEDEQELGVVVKDSAFKLFKGREMEVLYIATKAGARPRESLRRVIRVGELQADMPAPDVEQAQDGVLALADVSPFGTPVKAPFSEVEFGDWVTLHIQGAHSADLPKPVNIPGVAMGFDVLPQDLASNLNKDISIFYTLKRTNLPVLYSLTTPLRIV
ncbi:hypothetical protein DYL59_08945 [Pseudomonas kairouanensis]|uniref:Uncharacterized protein n=1 Tax=Pseudomonas kairouanensis TaxID=2293832 RepID=A0A4Z0AVN3_9PSED|nr:hypothetical protein [Pseudomonas kairouanensis]TFY90229.1 hypothetical protein DYL59_08945 [Pseudomonas kairouanensis]